MKIGVFDSGVGGLSVANAVKKALPEHEVLLREDKANLPYGNKSKQELIALVTPILTEMVNSGCGVILIACNTVTTNIISELRESISVPLIGMEPMVKPAARATKSGTIAVFATPATLASERYKWLKDEYAKEINVLEPDCSRWAKLIEEKNPDREEIRRTAEESIASGADVLVLGCTHYHWIEEMIKEIAAGQAQVIQPEGPVIEQLKRVLARSV